MATANVGAKLLKFCRTAELKYLVLRTPLSQVAIPNVRDAHNNVVSAVANGDLSQKMALDIEGRALKGQFLQTANTINTMVYQLNAFAAEVTRVARSAAHGHGLLSESRIGSSPAVLRPIKALTGQVAVSRPVPRSRPGLVA